MQTPLMDPVRIEKESFEIIDKLVPGDQRACFSKAEWEVARRAIHTTGDVEFHRIMEFHPDGVAMGIEALLLGEAVVTDTQMLLAGIATGRLKRLGVDAWSIISRGGVREYAQKMNITRSAAAVDLLMEEVNGGRRVGIVAIGNAPTALFRLLEWLGGKTEWRPRLIVGTPVGFVGAKESKEALRGSGHPYITCLGTRGGSTVAASIVNQLATLALQKKGS